MARKVYFSFHYQDVIDFRANVVRNSGKFRAKGDGFHDLSIWEEAEEKKANTIKGLIDNSLKGCGVTCVLVGTETYSRRWVRYELAKSFEMNKGQVAVGINWIKGKDGRIKFWPGENPFDYLAVEVEKNGKEIRLFENLNSKWISYRDLPIIKNRHFKKEYFGKSFAFSDFYKKYSYNADEGKKYFPDWIENAAVKQNR